MSVLGAGCDVVEDGGGATFDIGEGVVAEVADAVRLCEGDGLPRSIDMMADICCCIDCSTRSFRSIRCDAVAKSAPLVVDGVGPDPEMDVGVELTDGGAAFVAVEEGVTVVGAEMVEPLEGFEAAEVDVVDVGVDVA